MSTSIDVRAFNLVIPLWGDDGTMIKPLTEESIGKVDLGELEDTHQVPYDLLEPALEDRLPSSGFTQGLFGVDFETDPVFVPRKIYAVRLDELLAVSTISMVKRRTTVSRTANRYFKQVVNVQGPRQQSGRELSIVPGVGPRLAPGLIMALALANEGREALEALAALDALSGASS